MPSTSETGESNNNVLLPPNNNLPHASTSYIDYIIISILMLEKASLRRLACSNFPGGLADMTATFLSETRNLVAVANSVGH